MPKQPQVNTEYIKELYTRQHLTCAEIGKITGISRPGVWKRLQAAGITARQGEWVTAQCDHCGNEYELHRKRWRSHIKHFCKAECYHAYLYNPDYKQNRHGQRLAREIVARHFKLEPKNIVHHDDIDCKNNELTNLWVFASQSDHLKYHRTGRPQPIWKGSQVIEEEPPLL